MTLPSRLLVRVVGRLSNIWHSRAQIVARDEPYRLRHVRDHLEALQGALDRLDKARGLGLELILPTLRLEILGHLDRSRLAGSEAKESMLRPGVPAPGPGTFLDELRQIEDDFDDLSIDWKSKCIRAGTEPITLQDIYLGPFAIQFHWERLLHQPGSDCFDIVALDPHPAAANDRVSHPHVKDRSLCAGDASVPIRKALEHGRLADAFCLVRSVLEHYNPGSPHIALDEWEGTACHDCGRNVSEDERWCCEGCGCDFCDDCMGNCACCDATRCHGCLMRCDACEDPCCARCLESCSGSGQECCRHCRVSCVRCGATVARDDRAVAGLCPSCQPTPTLEHILSEKTHDPDLEPARPASP
ncbi:MAG: hypothetical protein JNM56_16315 [Planctomycetia bacterium]|nr:hypothetical protein [Planctomycetia bacterium]